MRFGDEDSEEFEGISLICWISLLNELFSTLLLIVSEGCGDLLGDSVKFRDGGVSSKGF